MGCRKWSLLAHAVPVSNENYIRDYPSRPENFCLTAAHRRRRCLYLTADTSNSTDTASTQECPPIKSMSLVFRPSVYKWLERELQALLCHEDVNLLVQHVMGSLERSRLLAGRPLHQVSAETGSKICDLVQQVVEPVFVQLNRQSDWSRRLAIEFVNFVASGLTVDAYDEAKEQQEVYQANCCEEEQP